MTLVEILDYLRHSDRAADLTAAFADQSAAETFEAQLQTMWTTIHDAKRAHDPLPDGLDIEPHYIIAGRPRASDRWGDLVRWPTRFAAKLNRERSRWSHESTIIPDRYVAMLACQLSGGVWHRGGDPATSLQFELQRLWGQVA